ncbi:LysR family transcriptional regulator [Paucibacter sp. R3-3]|uniref:LysR family transcriptional regulator n=1 Tax=Roseateles agri TaxID=3098619 RepID=A0ABU5DT76_9BURK|nr:LysR family transcriptional regulator [Paucibacter sp. R3-3]MDY0749071.1 LysR family transcriptional regulator [Paucibacter sp. R3-3]
MDLNDLRYFALIVEHGGFSAAERITHITKSKLSRRISLLEERMGVRLFQRSTRRLSLTEAGQAFYEHCAAMMVEAEAATQALEQLRASPAGTVRMTCPVAIAQFYLARVVADFMRQHPKVRVEIQSTDRVVNLIEERIDVALRVFDSGLEDPALVARRIASGHMVLVASPSYVAARPPIRTPADLAGHDTIGAEEDGREQIWTLGNSSNGHSVKQAHRPRLLCSDFTVQYEAAVGGVGIALLPLRIAWRGLENGALLRVAKEWATPDQAIHLVFVSRRGMLPSVRALIDHLAVHVPTAMA